MQSGRFAVSCSRDNIDARFIEHESSISVCRLYAVEYAGVIASRMSRFLLGTYKIGGLEAIPKMARKSAVPPVALPETRQALREPSSPRLHPDFSTKLAKRQ
jgi:hypothetical protein